MYMIVVKNVESLTFIIWNKHILKSKINLEKNYKNFMKNNINY